MTASCTSIHWSIGTPLPSMIPSLLCETSISPSSSINANGSGSVSADMIKNDDDHREDHISVMSFNLLAPVYVRPIDKRTGEVQSFAAFEWVKEVSLLDWENRKNRLLECLQSCRADVICLQELQMDRFSNSDNKDKDNDNINGNKNLVLPKWLRPLVREENGEIIGSNADECSSYRVVFPPQDQLNVIAERNVRVLGVDAAVTCAVLVRTNSEWELFGCEDCDNNNDGDFTNSSNSMINNKKTPTGGNLARNTNTCVSVCLRHRWKHGQIDPLVVTSVHLDATHEQKRVSQITRCLQNARLLLDASSHQQLKQNEQQQQITMVKNQTNKIPLFPLATIIAGDMNAEFLPGSCLSHFLNGHQRVSDTSENDSETQCAASLRLDKGIKPSTAQLDEWKNIKVEADQAVNDYCVSLYRVNSGATRCAYDHSAEIDDGANQIMAQWSIDHMLYTTDQIQPIAHWSTLEDDPESCASGLPNKRFPSDHLPIAAAFRIQQPIKLKEEEKQVLVDRMELILQTQKQATDDLNKRMDTELADLKTNLLNAAAAAETTTSAVVEKSIAGSVMVQSEKKKGKKKKNQPPPIEVRECIRKKRVLLKALREEHLLNRQGFVTTLDRSERLVIQETFGLTSSAWVSQNIFS